ncbi:MAG: glutamine-hydrolyzing carbamoyl-phosphate synthase small subunit [Planctomycetes bacterium]|nr:glutamine-hydrolyzing carbamoyl-phosphate synthase small subunit [Planctomycetota bacterium]
MIKPAILALEDGTIFRGRSFGADGECDGEVVFNTSMMGYPEILTDPSYRAQMVCMTYPLIGNYGITEEDFESKKIWMSGFIVKENSRIASNWRSSKPLGQLLKEQGIIGIEGVDTRRLVKHIREAGAMKGILSTTDLDEQSLVAKAKASPGLVGRDCVKEVSVSEPYEWTEACPDAKQKQQEFHVVAFDYGIKYNILRLLVSNGCKVTVVPAVATAEQVMAYKPDGVFLSNGPGDPAALPYIVNEVEKLIGKVPMFGICLGHQILAQALGGKTYKLKFGHHGGNQPVMRLCTREVEISSQNHGFTVDMDSLKDKPVEITHMNLNDNTVEGLAHKELPLFSVQYHPEAAPGPHDSRYLFGLFTDMMRTGKPVVA